MAIYISERTIGIRAPQICCDLCQVRLDMVGELWIAKIERVERDDMENNTDGTFIIPVIPATEEAALVAVSERGWVQETIHGKELLLCPSCKNK